VAVLMAVQAVLALSYFATQILIQQFLDLALQEQLLQLETIT
jgi:hypothetical protein